MPKLPKGMFRRPGRRSYYTRLREGGSDRWISLGTDYSEALRELRSTRRQDKPLKGPEVTVSKAAREWLAIRIATGRNENGRKLASRRVAMYLEPFMGHMLVSKVTTETARRYRVWLEDRCKSKTTVGHILADARNFLYWAEECGLVDRAPVPRMWLPRISERKPDRLLDEEVLDLVGISDPHGFVVRLALGTGLRWGELSRAQASDLENGMLVVGQTKSGRVRRIPVGEELHREIRGRIGRLSPFSERSSGSFNRVVRRLSGVQGFHVHQLRHTFACRWLERGGSLAALQELLGHRSIVTTQRYARLGEDHVRREAERVGLG